MNVRVCFPFAAAAAHALTPWFSGRTAPGIFWSSVVALSIIVIAAYIGAVRRPTARNTSLPAFNLLIRCQRKFDNSPGTSTSVVDLRRWTRHLVAIASSMEQNI